MIDRDLWLAAEREASDQPLPPSDALTVKEFGELLGVDRFGATRRLNQLVALKKAEKTTKLIRRSDGVVVRANAYRLIKGAVDVRHRDLAAPLPKHKRS